MRKIVLLLFVVLALMVSQQAKASVYHVDEISVDQLFDNAVETSMLDFNAVALNTVAGNADKNVVSGKDPMIALVLNFFLGSFGAHRFYMGTEVLTGIGYILTCGGLGIVNLIDFIVLIIHYDDISPFVNNPAFFMWKGMF
ncbi:MAG TPA: TM2 domain-containing protein [Prolixibacteraceae bacterium]|nr:TM2 domain-containing protein [Prolixibacteraceae bacterium]